MPQPVPAHDLWTTLALLQERLTTASSEEATRLQGHLELLQGRLALCAVPSMPVTPEPIEEAVDLDGQWQAILAEAQGQPVAAVPEATVSRPVAKTLPPRLMFSPEFLALEGDLPDEWAEAKGVAPETI